METQGYARKTMQSKIGNKTMGGGYPCGGRKRRGMATTRRYSATVKRGRVAMEQGKKEERASKRRSSRINNDLIVNVNRWPGYIESQQETSGHSYGLCSTSSVLISRLSRSSNP